MSPVKLKKPECEHERVTAVRKTKYHAKWDTEHGGVIIGTEFDTKLHFYCSECKKKLDPVAVFKA